MVRPVCRRLVAGALALVLFAPGLFAQRPAAPARQPVPAEPFSLDDVLSFPFVADLTSSPRGDRFAWTSVERGARTLWVAEGPAFVPRRLFGSGEDDGQELSNVAFSGDGRHVVFVRGGDHGANWPAAGGLQPNPLGRPAQPKLEIWSAAVDGSASRLLGEGDEPVPSPRGDRVVFVKGQELWVVPLDGSRPAERLLFARGTSHSPVWSPDGSRLAFVSDRGDLAYIAVYEDDGDARPLVYLAPSTSRDAAPRWSPDGRRVAFIRRPGRGGAARPPLLESRLPWAIWVADAGGGEAREIWRSPQTPHGDYPRTLWGPNLHWAAGDRLVFLSEADGWPHLYSVAPAGGDALLLTPGAYMVEYVTLSADRRFVIYNANAGSHPDDLERRHLFRVPVDEAAPVVLTEGPGIEWQPAAAASGAVLAYLASDARTPPAVWVKPLPKGPGRPLVTLAVPPTFPTARLVVPEHVTFAAPDGLTVHGQLFKASRGPGRGPAVVFVHGGPPRQMLLGWHYRYYYAGSYALNQYLASRGYVVLSVNYRLGIGYGYDFQHPERAGVRGASEYQDVVAGARYLQGRPDVDPARIGIWGGSYGGYLVALALGRNSDVFAAGVDIHGVHDRAGLPAEELRAAALVGDGVSEADLAEAVRVAWASSPAAWVGTWRSPVLLVHGDDDRNVRVEQTVDLVQRLRAAGVRFEELVVPDDVHGFLLHRNWRRVYAAAAAFFDRTLAARR